MPASIKRTRHVHCLSVAFTLFCIFIANTLVAQTLVLEKPHLEKPLITENSLIVKKQRFVTQNFKTFSGTILPEVEIGWESYGTLNAEKDNVILVPHYFTGTSHAAGKYSETDEKPGYWDVIIGPGKAIDTNKFFVISADSLVNANVKDPKVFSTGPSSINPQTNKPYGLDFPVVTMRDFVNIQHALVKSLSINKLYAVVGASMGSHQALEWASAYPAMVPRVISVIGLGETDVYGKASIELWVKAIKQDPNWNNGDYYGKDEPIDGIAKGLYPIMLNARHSIILDKEFRQTIEDDRKPWQSIRHDFAISTWLDSAAKARAATIDANHLLYLTRAVQLFRIGHKKTLEDGLSSITAKVLFLPSENDRLLLPTKTKKVYDILKKQGRDVSYEEIKGPWGHLNGLLMIAQKAETISKFLSE